MLKFNVVPPGSNAEAAGIKAGDLLDSYNGVVVRSSPELEAAISGAASLPSVTIEIIRAGRRFGASAASGRLGVILGDASPGEVAEVPPRTEQDAAGDAATPSLQSSGGTPRVAPVVMLASPQAASERSEVAVTDISMPFMSMVVFMVKWALASIPAFLILFVLFYVLAAMFGLRR